MPDTLHPDVLTRLRAALARRNATDDAHQSALDVWEAGLRNSRDPAMLAATEQAVDADYEWRELVLEVVPELLDELERLRRATSKIAWDRDGVGPDVPVLQERYDALREEVRRLRDLIRRAYAGDPDDLYAEGERLNREVGTA